MFLKVFFVLLFIQFSFGIESDEDCGVADETEGLIVGGHEVITKEWPWSVAVFHREGKAKYQFICGGTLITRKKVITASHCIHEKYTARAKRVEDFVLKLGAFNIAVREANSLTVIPTSLMIHPDWNPAISSYDADIAIFEMPEEVGITKFIRPICIWERRRGAPQFDEGVVVGWGLGDKEQKSYENIARKVVIPKVSNEQCFLDQRQFTSISSNRTFCGGAKKGEGPCKGDSGSGLYFEHDNKVYIGGIVSASTLDVFQNCDVQNYAVYTDVYKFVPWLSNKKFNEKSSFEIACDSYKHRPKKRPIVYNNLKVAPNEAEVGEFPHMALIGYARVEGIKFRRNGFLVSEKFVLTSAYSIVSALILVRLGAITEDFKYQNGDPVAVDINVKRMIRHESYNGKTKKNDIGLLELEHAAPLSYFVWPACLFSHVDQLRRMWTASSWQHLNDEELAQKFYQKVPVQEISIDECQASLESKRKLSPHQLCAKSIIKNIAICAGSSGDPLQTFLDGDSYYIGAISSFGVSCEISFLSAYTRISSYADWIEERVWAEEAAT